MTVLQNKLRDIYIYIYIYIYIKLIKPKFEVVILERRISICAFRVKISTGNGLP